MITRVLFLILLVNSYVFGAETIYTWGYGDILGETLIMIKNVFQVNTFNDLWKLVLLISSIIGAVSMMYPNSDPFRLPKVMIVSMGVWSIFVTATIDVYIDDKVEPNFSKAITNVPWAVGYPFALFSQIEKVTGELYEQVSSTPTSLSYSNTGFFTPISIFNASSHQKIVDPRLFRNSDTYIKDCAMPDFENGYKDFNSLANSTNVWTYLGDPNPSTITKYINDDGTVVLKGCDDYYSQVSTDLNTYIQGKGLSVLGEQIGLTGASTISTMLQSSNNYLLNASKSATDILKQNVSINMFDQSFKSYSASNGVNSNSTAYYAGKGESTAQANMIISGILGSKYVPITKGILTTILAGLTPMVALLMLTPMGMKVFMGYFTSLTWLALWHLGDVILNHIITVKTQSALSALTSDMTFQTKGIIDSTTLDYINMASSMYWLIPTISLFLVGGLSLGVLSSIGGGMTGKVARGENTAMEMGSGSASQGNVSANNYSANKWGSARQMNAGTDFSFTNAGGGNSYHNANATSGGKDTTVGNWFTNASGESISQNNNLNNNQGTVVTSNSTTGAITEAKGQFQTGANGQKELQTGTSSTSYGSNDKFGRVTSNSQVTNGIITKDTTTDNKGSVTDTTYNGITGKKNTENVQTTDGSKFATIATKDGDYKVTQATIAGKTITQTDTSSEAFTQGVTAKTTKGFAEQYNANASTEEKATLSNNVAKSFDANGEAQVKFDTKDQVTGKLAAYATGLSAGGTAGAKYSYNENTGVLTMSGNGKTATIALSGDAREMYETSYSSNKAQATQKAFQDNKMIDYVNDKFHNESGTLTQKAENLVANKDTLSGDFQKWVTNNDEIKNGVATNTNNTKSDVDTKSTDVTKDPNGALSKYTNATAQKSFNEHSQKVVDQAPGASINKAVKKGLGKLGIKIDDQNPKALRIDPSEDKTHHKNPTDPIDPSKQITNNYNPQQNPVGYNATEYGNAHRTGLMDSNNHFDQTKLNATQDLNQLQAIRQFDNQSHNNVLDDQNRQLIDQRIQQLQGHNSTLPPSTKGKDIGINKELAANLSVIDLGGKK